MKAVSKLVVLLSMGLLTAAAASATTSWERAYLESCRKDPGVPVPYAIVSPDIGPEFHGGRVELEFLVDTKGKPAEFSVTYTSDDALAKAVVKAVKQWRFLPAESDGKPVATKVSLPVHIVDPVWAGATFAAKE